MRAILKTEGTIFPNMDGPRLVNELLIFSIFAFQTEPDRQLPKCSLLRTSLPSRFLGMHVELCKDQS